MFMVASRSCMVLTCMPPRVTALCNIDVAIHELVPVCTFVAVSLMYALTCTFEHAPVMNGIYGVSLNAA